MPVIPKIPELETGNYVIKSFSTGYFVARNSIEDKSLRSKAIVLRREGGADATWVLIKNGDGTYNMVNRNTPAFQKGDKLFGLLGPEEQPVEVRWRISAVPQHGKDVYIIENYAGLEGWLVTGVGANGTGAERTQISVGGLVATRSLPPLYRTNELFIIKRA
ncbi:hypothetical protein TWF696_004579 [Orbilia brochopaga]|uniref:Uncharacterized protein n=1 Tax=Orbilia brochopaga TaxID=3140254 RepID=A0AAV9V9W3_9PEZI